MSAESDEGNGYCAIIAAAATLATSSICGRKAQGVAEDFLLREIERWDRGDAAYYDDDPAPEPEETPAGE